MVGAAAIWSRQKDDHLLIGASPPLLGIILSAQSRGYGSKSGFGPVFSRLTSMDLKAGETGIRSAGGKRGEGSGVRMLLSPAQLSRTLQIRHRLTDQPLSGTSQAGHE